MRQEKIVGILLAVAFIGRPVVVRGHRMRPGRSWSLTPD